MGVTISKAVSSPQRGIRSKIPTIAELHFTGGGFSSFLAGLLIVSESSIALSNY